MERKPSEIIQEFLDLIDNSHTEFNDSKTKVDNYNSKTYTWTHQLEDCKNKQERNRLATAWQKELKERRKEKDRKNLWEKIHNFGADVSNKTFLKKLRHLVQEQQKVEEYLETPYEKREYKKGKGNNVQENV